MINTKRLKYENKRYRQIPTNKVDTLLNTYGSKKEQRKHYKIRLTVSDGKTKGKSRKVKNVLPNIKNCIKQIDIYDAFFVGAAVLEALNMCEELNNGKKFLLGSFILKALSKAFTKELTENECKVIYWLIQRGYDKKNKASISEERLVEGITEESILDEEGILNAINSLKEKQCIDIIDGNIILLEKVVVHR